MGSHAQHHGFIGLRARLIDQGIGPVQQATCLLGVLRTALRQIRLSGDQARVALGQAICLAARYAEGLFWMARYLERVENLARLVDVTQTFEAPGREAESWFALVQINADEAMRPVFNGKSQVSMFEMTKLVSGHIR